MVVKVMNKFLKRSQEAQLELNQNNTYLEELSCISSGKKNKNSDVEKIQKLSFVQIYFHSRCHKIYTVMYSMR